MLSDQMNPYWESQDSVIEVSLELPQTRAASERALRDLPAFMAGALKKRSAVEVHERRLTPEELTQFQGAKAVEVNNFIASKAFQAVPEHLRPSRDQVVRMRWILTWKHKEPGQGTGRVTRISGPLL